MKNRSLSWLGARALTFGWAGMLLSATTAAEGPPSPTGSIALKAPAVVRFQGNPIIRPEMVPGTDGANICGPSLIRVPRWLPNPLGKYYLYFADHKGAYIRMAYADQVEGPWKVYAPGTLKLEDMVAVAKAAAGASAAANKGEHIASPDVHVDDAKQEIRMYFHFQIAPKTTWGHRTGVALSKNGIDFRPVNRTPIGEPYFRVFRWDGYYYAVNRITRACCRSACRLPPWPQPRSSTSLSPIITGVRPASVSKPHAGRTCANTASAAGSAPRTAAGSASARVKS